MKRVMMLLLSGLFMAVGLLAAEQIGSQILVGGDRSTILHLTNSSEEPQAYLAEFFSAKYSFLAISVNGGEEKVSLGGAIPPKTTLAFVLTRGGEPTTGWVQVQGGDIEGRLTRSEGEINYPSTPLTYPGHKFVVENAAWVLSDQAGQSEVTGLALTNPSPWPTHWVVASIQAYDERGSFVAEETLLGERALKPRHQVAVFLGEIFAGNVSWDAYLRLAAGGGFRGSLVIRSLGDRRVGQTALNVKF